MATEEVKALRNCIAADHKRITELEKELAISERALELLAKISPLENADNELAQARAEVEGGDDEHPN